MASFNDLVELQNDIIAGEKHIVVPNDFAIESLDSVGDHLPDSVRLNNDTFVNMNAGIPGVMNFDAAGYTEPESRRDCWANNYALAHLNEIMPYLEKMNQYLSDEQISSPDYSKYTLHLAAECMQAQSATMSDKPLSDEKVDFMIETATQKDYGYFGCKHHEYNMFQIRRDFQDRNMSIDNERVMTAINDESRLAVELYCDTVGFDKQVIETIGRCNDMDVACAIEDCLEQNNIDIKQADTLVKCMNRINDYAHSEENVNSDGGRRISMYRMEQNTQAFVNVINQYPRIGNNEAKMNMIASNFIDDKTHSDLASYIDDNPDDMKMYSEGMGDEHIMQFYTGSIPVKNMQSFLDKNNMKSSFGMESQGFNGDTHVFYNPDTYTQSCSQEWVKAWVKWDGEHIYRAFGPTMTLDKDPRAEQEKSVATKSSVAEKEMIVIDNNNAKCKRKMTSKDGVDFYQVGISVDKKISESGYVNVTCSPDSITENGKTFSVTLPANSERTVDVVKGGKHVKDKMIMSDLNKAHEASVRAYRQASRTNTQTGVESSGAQLDNSQFTK